MTSLSQWTPRYRRLKPTTTTPATTKAVARARTTRLRPTDTHTAMIPRSAPIPATCPDGNESCAALKGGSARISTTVTGRQMTALIAVSANTAPATVPMTTNPGLNERARQASSAATTSPAAATVAGLPHRAIRNDASSMLWDRWTLFPTQDAVGASNAVTHPWTCTPIASRAKTDTRPESPKIVGSCKPRTSLPIAKNNSDAHQNDDCTVDDDIPHPDSHPSSWAHRRRPDRAQESNRSGDETA